MFLYVCICWHLMWLSFAYDAILVHCSKGFVYVMGCYPHMPIGKVWVYRLLFFVFLPIRISLQRIKLAASNFARRFIGVQDREAQIFVNFAPSEAQNRTSRPAGGRCKPYRCNVGLDVGSACVDIRQSSSLMEVIVYVFCWCILTKWIESIFSARVTNLC